MCAVAAQTVAVFGTLAHLPLECTVSAAMEGKKWLHACRCKLCAPKEHVFNGKLKIQHCISGAAPFLLCFPSLDSPFYAMVKWAETCTPIGTYLGLLCVVNDSVISFTLSLLIKRHDSIDHV